jgi:outer membrane protein assembly factor BamB
MLTARGVSALLTAALLLVTPAADIPSGTPTPVRWRPVWSAAAPADADAVNWRYRTPLGGATAQALAMADGKGAVRVHDARTGALTRTITTSGTTVAGVWVASGTVVVLTEGGEGSGQRRRPYTEDRDAGQTLQAYDVATGTALWGHAVGLTREGSRPGTGSYRGPQVMVTERGVVLAERPLEPLTLLSLDLRSGRTLASTVHERRCDLTAGAGARSVLLLDYCAGNRVRLASVDPATLRPEWTRALPSPALTFPATTQVGDPPSLGLTVGGDGYAKVVADDFAAFYGPDGRRLSTVQEALTPADSVRGGRWTEPIGVGALPPDGDGQTEWPLPAFLTSLDIITGRLRPLPLDVPHANASLVGTAGDLAFVRSGERVTAYALTYGAETGRPLFGDVPRDAWPDACGLLTAADLRPLAEGYAPRPVTRALLGRPLPKPVRCDWIPPSDDAPAVSVSVEWVSHSDTAARRILAAETASIKRSYAYDPVTEDPHLLDYLHPTNAGAATAPESVVGAGPVIVRLTSVSRPALRLLAPVVRDELLARHGLPQPVPTSDDRVRWSFPTDGNARNAPVATGGVVYTSGGGRVYALNASSGSPRWAHTIGDVVASFQVVDGQVYAVAWAALHGFDARTGRLKWRYQSMGVRGEGVAVAGGRVIVCAGKETVALDAASGRRLWRFKERGCFGSDPLSIDLGAVYVSGGNDTVYALDAATGRRRWSVRGDSDVTPAGRLVYVGTGNRVRALDAASGAERWSTPVGDGSVHAPVLSGTAFYARDSAGTLHALDARTGKRRWTFSPGVVTTFPLARVTVSGNRIYLVGPGGVVHALDAASGGKRWSTPVGSHLTSTPVAHAGVVYAEGHDAVHALDGETGARKWHARTGSLTVIGPVVAGGLVYANGSGNVYALGPAAPPGPGR